MLSNKAFKLIICLLFFVFFTIASATNILQKNMKYNMINSVDEENFIIDLFVHFINDIPFEVTWNKNFSNEIENYFKNKVSPELLPWGSKISFAGEFLRFQYFRILNKNNEKYSINVYKLPKQMTTYNFGKTQPLKRINFNDIENCFEFLVQLNIFNFNSKNRGIISFNFHIGITRLDSGTIILEYCDFLSNNQLALNGKISTLENIPEEIIQEYLKWLISQQTIYEKL